MWTMDANYLKTIESVLERTSKELPLLNMSREILARATTHLDLLRTVLAQLHDRPPPPDENQGKRSARLREIAAKIASGPGKTWDKIALWMSKTGLGRAIYFRYRKSVIGN